MKTVREYIEEATKIGYDIAVEDYEGLWEHCYGGWHSTNDNWFNEENYYDNAKVLRVEMWEEEKMMVLVLEEVE